MMIDTRDRIARHLRQLAPHVKERDTGLLLIDALAEIDRMHEQVEKLSEAFTVVWISAERDGWDSRAVEYFDRWLDKINGNENPELKDD